MDRTKWFTRRKYGGWGLTPKTWQGWVYVLVIMIPIFVISFIPTLNETQRLVGILAWLAIVLFDVSYIMVNMDKDEREVIHEAIAERNALYGILFVLIISLLYKMISAAFNEEIFIDWWIMTALFVGTLIKAITNIYLDKKD